MKTSGKDYWVDYVIAAEGMTASLYVWPVTSARAERKQVGRAYLNEHTRMWEIVVPKCVTLKYEMEEPSQLDWPKGQTEAKAFCDLMACACTAVHHRHHYRWLLPYTKANIVRRKMTEARAKSDAEKRRKKKEQKNAANLDPAGEDLPEAKAVRGEGSESVDRQHRDPLGVDAKPEAGLPPSDIS